MTIGVASTCRQHLAGDRVAVRPRSACAAGCGRLEGTSGRGRRRPRGVREPVRRRGGGSVAPGTMGPVSTRPVPFVGACSAFRLPTVSVLDGGGSTGIRGSDRLSPGLIRSSRRARSASSNELECHHVARGRPFGRILLQEREDQVLQGRRDLGVLEPGRRGAALMCWPITDIALPTNGTSPVAHS